MRPRSRAVWTSSSAGVPRNSPERTAASRSSSAPSSCASSSSVSSVARCSTRAWARDPARSYGASRQSKCTDSDSAASASEGPPAKRPPQSRVPGSSVNATLHPRTVQDGLVRPESTHALRVRGDLLGAALVQAGRLQFTEEVVAAELPPGPGGVLLELRAGVGDVEVAHRQLPDSVDRAERGVLRPFP